METLVKADIFFFITSIAVVVLTGLLSVFLYYLVKAGRSLYLLSEALQNSFKDSEDFVIELKERLEANPIFRWFFPSPIKRKQANTKSKKR